MNEYFGELENEEKQHYFRFFPVMAETPEEAYAKLSHMIEEGKTGVYIFIYQISKKIEGVELPQPVFDFMNGFEIYK